jgi:hypothetical protein
VSKSCEYACVRPSLSVSRRQVSRSFLGLLAVLGLFLASGCAGKACRDTRAAFESFENRRAVATQPHARLTIPYRTLDLLLAAQVRRLPGADVPLPAVAGTSLGTLRAQVEGLRARPGAPGTLGLTIGVGLRSGNRTLVGFELDADVRPSVDTVNGVVLVPLRGEDLRGVRPRIGPGGTRALVDHLHGQLPAPARAMVSKGQLTQILDGALQQLTTQASDRLVRQIGGQLGTIATIELDLGNLPLRTVELRSAPDAVVFGIVTPLPITKGVGLEPDTAQPQTVALRLSGDAVAALANHALRTGLVDDRYDDAGEPDPRGRWTPRLDWREGSQPMLLNLWCLQRDCAHVQLAGTAQLGVRGGQLEFRTVDARIVKVRGSSKVRAGVFFSGLGRRTFAWVEKLAGAFSFDAAGQPITARIMTAELHHDELLLILAVAAR